MIEGALKADGRIAAKNAVKIRAALRELADYKKLYLQYQETMPESSGNLARDRTRARAWAIMNVTQFRTEALASSLWRMWAEAYVLGTVAASEWLRITREINKADDDVSVDWDNWKPGDRAATLMLQRPKAFQQILDSTNVTIRGLTQTSITDIGNSLAEANDLGLDASSAALLISRNVASPARALTIAITEQNRVISAATMARYKEAGLEKQEWAVSDPCDICAKNDGAVVPIGTSFPSGDTQPPAHPHCRCVLLPVIPGMEEEPVIPGAEITPMPDEMAYVGNAPQASPVINVADQTDVLPGATARNNEIEAEIENMRATLGKNVSDERLIDALRAEGSQGEIDNTDLYWPMKKKFETMGFSPDDAGMQTRGVFLRTESYIENKRLKDYVARQIDDWEAPVAARYKERLQIVEQRLSDAMKNGNVTIAVDRNVLTKIFEDGKFKNQFDTKKSGGLLDFSRRKTTEKAVLDLDVNIPNQQRPIYGYITDNQTKVVVGMGKDTQEYLDTVLTLWNSRTSQYGQIKVVLKDSVKNRATATIGDSFGKNIIGDNLLEAKPDLNNMGLYRYGAPTGNVGVPDFSYFETQIKGGVTLDDVESIYLPFTGGKNDLTTEAIEEIRQMVKASGRDIKVIEMGADK
jgi:SPP1 gp7 family putative phage head morphogenesis protein